MLWLIFAVVLAIIFYQFLNWSAQKETRDWARAADDRVFRDALTAELQAKIASGDAAKDAALWSKCGQLYYFAGRLNAAVAAAEKYAAAAPLDAEGWAEAAEYNLLAGRLDAARQAIKQALARRERDDYRALAARIELQRGDLTAAATELTAWRKLDAERMARPATAPRWFAYQQIPRGEIVPDPAIAYYEAVLAALRGTDDAARLASENPDFWEAMLRTRLVPIIAPITTNAPEPPPFAPDAYATQIYAEKFDATLIDKLAQVRRTLAEKLLPQIVVVVCADADTREAVVKELGEGNE
ncbi:MAG: hypothetical protein LBP75_03620 [Planctomycetota bacterium]|jgi:tetratricopeptide (TPR) repeat protein|nr:hypothetical protein [Planctomycetota bacterium]